MLVPIDQIKVEDDHRPLWDVAPYVDSIRELGLLTPILVTPDLVLLNGRHRLEACLALGWTEIEVTTRSWEEEARRKLAKIDADLIGNPYTVIERGDKLQERKEWYERLHPEARHGGDRRSEAVRSSSNNYNSVPSFVESASSVTRESPASIYQDIQIARNLAPEVKARIARTPLADQKVGLLTLARQPAATQIEAVVRVLAGEARDLQSAVRLLTRETRMEAIVTAQPDLPTDAFHVLYADPPWRYDFSRDKADEIEEHYPTLDIDEICALNVPKADDSVLFLWGTSPKLHEALRVIDAWGFDYKTCAVWVKNWISTGYYFRQRHELLLVGTRGNLPVPAESDRPDSVIEAPKTKHSQKPPQVYGLIERMYPDLRRVELFAREKREGWSAWGNEV